MEIIRLGEIEIKETLIAVVLNNANCTVLTAQLTIAKLGLTKLHLNPSGRAGAELEIEGVVATSLVIGMIQYYALYIPMLAEMKAKLTELTLKGVVFYSIWSKNHEDARAILTDSVLFGFLRTADLGQQYDTVSRVGGN